MRSWNSTSAKASRSPFDFSDFPAHLVRGEDFVADKFDVATERACSWSNKILNEHPLRRSYGLFDTLLPPPPTGE